jgi:two-component system phosphate regulon response regulator OmpR
MNQPHILVVDDDEGIRKLIRKFLIEHGYVISLAANVKECKLLLEQFVFDLIIMDIMMPGESGINFVKNNQQTLAIPVLMLSALGDVDDRVNGLESGAADYLAKPFEPKELLLRINNLLKRSDKNDNYRFVFGAFELDLKSGNLSKRGISIHLTSTEKKLLLFLVANNGKKVSREDLINVSPEANLRSIDAQIARLRVKIEEDPKVPIYLQTIRGIGYVFWS